jgi:hypothetical protein
MSIQTKMARQVQIANILSSHQIEDNHTEAKSNLSQLHEIRMDQMSVHKKTEHSGSVFLINRTTYLRLAAGAEVAGTCESTFA